MNPLSYLARIFIDTFGITRPAPGRRQRAARYIAFLLLMVLCLVLATIALGLASLRH